IKDLFPRRLKVLYITPCSEMYVNRKADLPQRASSLLKTHVLKALHILRLLLSSEKCGSCFTLLHVAIQLSRTI
uniref:Uncharacterized protein n=1 Tax=Prolemur simus TaxID=1328070 RepID=A0A8C8ZGS1_PROSS